jgi:toxin YoeB
VVAGAGPQGAQAHQRPAGRIQRNGNEGIGKPEALKHDLAGYWFRRITDEHRLVYKITSDGVRIAACRYHYG